MFRPILIVRDLHKTYTLGKSVKVHALRGVSFDVSSGEMVAIMGPSGSGKTTLMNQIGALDIPDSGEIILEDMVITSKLSDSQLAYLRGRKIGFIFQAYNLINTLTALENVAFPAILSGYLTPKKAKERATELLERVGIGKYIHHRPLELSGGQQQRVALARALINRPAIILGDEPTGNLDSHSADEIMEMFKEMNLSFGQTFVIVTHDPRIAAQCDRTIYLKDGVIVDSPPPGIIAPEIIRAEMGIKGARLKILQRFAATLPMLREKAIGISRINDPYLKGKEKIDILEELISINKEVGRY
ncbi:MAG: ABC transporter ATP-binding protein [Candidatus Korarchaeota archaeon]